MQTVLLVDDEVGLVNAVSRALEDAGYRVLAAYDGRSALQMLASEPVDLLLSDIVMPGLFGTDVIRIARESMGLGHVPVILMSVIGEDRVRELFPLGDATFLPKPFTLSDVTGAVQSVLARPRPQD